jgi:DUF4097 and DUF4098 domain-containing protein YvlB
MRGITSAGTIALCCVLATAPKAIAQNSNHDWNKTYQFSGRPTLSIETGDAQLQIHSCGDCRQIRIKAEVSGQTLNDYRVEENQSGDHVSFRFKEKSHVNFSFHTDWRTHRAMVSIEAPAELALDAKTSDGNVEITGLRGEFQLHSGDGRLDLNDLSGSLVLKSGDGHVRIANFNGSIDATVSDGGITADGIFTGLTVHSSDGTVDLTAREHSQATKAWGIKTADGGVKLRLPKDLSADLDVHTSDGKIDSTIPLTIEKYESRNRPENELHGRMNGGGGPITIKTTDGSVLLETD